MMHSVLFWLGLLLGVVVVFLKFLPTMLFYLAVGCILVSIGLVFVRHFATTNKDE